MSIEKIKGVISPVLTAFDRDGAVYDDGCRNILNFQLPYVNGFFVCGSYGSGGLMSVKERMHVLEVMTDHINGRVPTIVHAGTMDTYSTIKLARHAQSTGVDAIAVMPPFFYKHNEENILGHYKAVLDAVDKPVFVYDYPSLSNNPISTKTLKNLAEMGTAGVKLTSSDLPGLLERMVAITKKGFAFMIGTEALLLAAISHGAQACITGMANSLPFHLAKLYQAICNGDHKEARKLQLLTNKAHTIIKRAPAISSVYGLMHYQGVDAGYPRLPFQKIESKDILPEINNLEKAGLLPKQETN